MADGQPVALSLTLEALAEDCTRATVIVSPREAPPPCTAAVVIDRSKWRQGGALALYRAGEGFVIEPARPPGYDRPWAPARAGVTSARNVNRAPDATPRPQDLEAGD
jgi:competence protein ComEC